MLVRLTVCSVDQAAVEFELDKDKAYKIGRAGDNDIVISAPSISRSHASLTFENNQWVIEDLGSQNGIWFGNQRQFRYALSQNTALKLGDISLIFEFLDPQTVDAERAHNQWRKNAVTTLASQLDLQSSENILLELLNNLVQLANMQRGILLIGNSISDMRMKITCGMLTQDLEVEEFSGSVGAIQAAIQSKKPIISMDTSNHAMLSQRDTTQLKNIAALACIPLIGNNETIGLVYTDSHQPGKILKQLDLDILMSISAQISTNLQSLLLQDNLKKVLEQLKEKTLPVVVDIPLTKYNQ